MLIWIDAVGRHGGEFLLLIAFVAQAFCGMASVTANSRMLYAFSRDGAVPGHKLWHRINPRTRTPTNGIWFCVVFAFILALPSLWSGVAYARGHVDRDHRPLHRLRHADPAPPVPGKSFVGGPWSLGKLSPVVGWVGIIWVGFICVLFMLPTVSPVNHDTFNYAPDRCRRRAALLRDLLARLGPQVVHRPEDSGRRGAAESDRGPVRATSSRSWRKFGLSEGSTGLTVDRTHVAGRFPTKSTR